MSGHSKWDNIKHRKGAQDAARAKVFAKISKEIMVAAASGGGDPASNSALRLVLTKARAKSMPKKNIATAINKATGAGANAANFKEIVYGGNVNGVAFLVVYLTDNANRVAANVQAAFKRSNGSVGSPSSVSYIFDRKGIFVLSGEGKDEDEFMMMALEAGAEDFENQNGEFYIYTDPSEFSTVKDNLEKEGIKEFTQAEVTYIPNNEMKLPKEKAEKILQFIEKLEDDDDLQEVYHNLDADSLN